MLVPKTQNLSGMVTFPPTARPAMMTKATKARPKPAIAMRYAVGSFGVLWSAE
jgi:hypothetical protein